MAFFCYNRLIKLSYFSYDRLKDFVSILCFGTYLSRFYIILLVYTRFLLFAYVSKLTVILCPVDGVKKEIQNVSILYWKVIPYNFYPLHPSIWVLVNFLIIYNAFFVIISSFSVYVYSFSFKSFNIAECFVETFLCYPKTSSGEICFSFVFLFMSNI